MYRSVLHKLDRKTRSEHLTSDLSKSETSLLFTTERRKVQTTKTSVSPLIDITKPEELHVLVPNIHRGRKKKKSIFFFCVHWCLLLQQPKRKQKRGFLTDQNILLSYKEDNRIESERETLYYWDLDIISPRTL